MNYRRHRNSIQNAAKIAAGLFLSSAILFFSTSRADTANAPSVFHSPDFHYQLKTPPGWTAVSQVVLDEKNLASDGMRTVAAFQTGAGDLNPPMLVISHIDEPGRTLADINDELASDSRLTIGKNGQTLIYDEKHGAVMTTESVHSQDGNTYRRLAVFKPGKLGVVHLDFYLGNGTRPVYTEAIVLNALDSFAFDEGYDGEPNRPKTLLDDVRSKLRGNPLLIGAILLGIVGVTSGLIRRRASA